MLYPLLSKLPHLFAIRHGESLSNVLATREQSYQDFVPPAVPLTGKGVQQAAAVAAWLPDYLAKLSVEKIWLIASSYYRAQQTAEPLREALNERFRVTFMTDDRLGEHTNGFSERASDWAEHSNDPVLAKWSAQHRRMINDGYGQFAHAPHGETPAGMALRSTSLLQDLLLAQVLNTAPDVVIVVGHGLFFRYWRQLFAGKTWQDVRGKDWQLPNGSVWSLNDGQGWQEPVFVPPDAEATMDG